MILRLLYKKNGFIRFNAHLDMVRIFERSLRRAGVDLAFSQGFNPHPKMSFAAPLSVGVASDYEIIDIEVLTSGDIKDLVENCEKYFPGELEIVSAKLLEKSRAPMSMISRAEYICEFSIDKDIKIDDKDIESFLNKESIEYYKISKKGKSKEPKLIDIKPYIYSLELMQDREQCLKMCIAQGSEFNLKPEIVTQKLVEHLGAELIEDSIRLKRTCMWGNDNSGNLIELYDLI